MRLLVLPVLVCLLYAFVWVTCVAGCVYMHTCGRYVCSSCMYLMGIHFQPCYWLDLGSWSSGSFASRSVRSGMVFSPSIVSIRYSEHDSWEQDVSSRSFLMYWMEEREGVFSEVGTLMNKERSLMLFLHCMLLQMMFQHSNWPSIILMFPIVAMFSAFISETFNYLLWCCTKWHWF